MWAGKYKYDAFVSHAVEDKLPIANELCARLEQEGLKIWYSGKELKVGDSLERTILRGLDDSRYGIVILSPTYIKKNWPRKEFYLMMAKEIEQRKVILPILYNITNEELQSLDISIAGRWAIPYEKGMDFVVQKLLEVILSKEDNKESGWLYKLLRDRLNLILILCLMLLASYFVYARVFYNRAPSARLIENVISKRIKDLELKMSKEHELALSEWDAKPASIADINKVFADFSNLKSGYRNEYEFDNGFKTIQFKKNVEAALQMDVTALAPYHTYNFTAPNIFMGLKEEKGRSKAACYILMNTQPFSYSVSDEQYLDNGDYEVTVTYNNNVRCLKVNLLFPVGIKTLKRHQLSMRGFLPVEKYIFQKHADEWLLKTVD